MIKQNIRSISIVTPTKIISVSCLRHYNQETKLSSFSGYFEKTWTKNKVGVFWAKTDMSNLAIFHELTKEHSKVIREIVSEHE